MPRKDDSHHFDRLPQRVEDAHGGRINSRDFQTRQEYHEHDEGGSEGHRAAASCASNVRKQLESKVEKPEKEDHRSIRSPERPCR